MPFPSIIDNSMRSAFVACPKRFAYSYLQHLAPKVPSVHLHAGIAFARGLEVTRKKFYGEGVNAEDSLAFGIKALIEAYGDFEPEDTSTKSLARMAGALVAYFDTYLLETDFLKPATMANGKLGIEFDGLVALPILHPETGEALLYSGRFDMLALKDGVLFVEDDKTTGQLGPTWGQRWDLNAQFTGYCWLVKQYDFPVAGAIIRGISILKESYGHAQCIIYRPEWQIQQWYEQLLRDVTRMVDCYERGVFDLALSDACSAFGGCAFRRLCSVNDPSPWIKTEFVVREYSPPGSAEQLRP